MKSAKRPFTGWHAAMILCAFFGTVVAVNFTMAAYARSTFGGIVVENSYVASQQFNRWLDEAKQSAELGWKATPTRLSNGRLSVVLEGAPASVELSGMARHPLGRMPDLPLSFAAQGNGRFETKEHLPEGRWIVRFEGRSGNDLWRAEEALR